MSVVHVFDTSANRMDGGVWCPLKRKEKRSFEIMAALLVLDKTLSPIISYARINPPYLKDRSFILKYWVENFEFFSSFMGRILDMNVTISVCQLKIKKQYLLSYF